MLFIEPEAEYIYFPNRNLPLAAFSFTCVRVRPGQSQLLAAGSTLSPAVCQVSFVLPVNCDDDLVPQALYVTVSLFHSDGRLTASGHKVKLTTQRCPAVDSQLSSVQQLQEPKAVSTLPLTFVYVNV